MKIALFAINAASVDPLTTATADTVLAAGHDCVRIEYWFVDHFPVAAFTSQKVPLLTLVDGGFPSAPCLSAGQYIAGGGAVRDFADLALHDHAVHGWPLTRERLWLESTYYQRLRGISLKARSLLKAVAPDAVLVTHGAEPLSRAISIESAALGIPVMMLESSFFPGFVTLDVGGQHFFSGRSRLAKILPRKLSAALTDGDAADVRKFLSNWRENRQSKYAQTTSGADRIAIDRFVDGANGRVVFLPAQLPFDANVIPGLGTFASLPDLYDAAANALADWKIVLKPHPMDTSGEVARRLSARPNVLVARNVDVHDIIPRADVVVTVSSNAGFEALLLGKPVVVLGKPYYAHPGLVSASTDMNDLPGSVRRAAPPDPELVERLLHTVAFDHLVPIGDGDRFDARLKEAIAAGPEAWRALETLVDAYPPRARAYLDLVERYDSLARQDLSHDDICRRLPELADTRPPSRAIRMLDRWRRKRP